MPTSMWLFFAFFGASILLMLSAAFWIQRRQHLSAGQAGPRDMRSGWLLGISGGCSLAFLLFMASEWGLPLWVGKSTVLVAGLAASLIAFLRMNPKVTA